MRLRKPFLEKGLIIAGLLSVSLYPPTPLGAVKRNNEPVASRVQIIKRQCCFPAPSCERQGQAGTRRNTVHTDGRCGSHFVTKQEARALIRFQRIGMRARAFSDEVGTGSSKKMRPNKKLERQSDSNGSECALVSPDPKHPSFQRLLHSSIIYAAHHLMNVRFVAAFEARFESRFSKPDRLDWRSPNTTMPWKFSGNCRRVCTINPPARD